MIGLERLGLLAREGDRYRNTGLAEHLTSSAPVPLAALLVWGKLFYPMWGNLENAVRENSPRWQETFGSTQQETFSNLYKDPEALRRFCGIMSAYSIPQGSLLGRRLTLRRIDAFLMWRAGPAG